MQISYTSIKNFQGYFTHSKKNKFGIWAWEWAGKNCIANGFAKQYKYCDVLVSPSNFCKRVFMESGIPESIIKVIPHGIDVELFKKNETIKLPTNKKYKIGVVLAQNHLRKNIPGMLEAYGKAFNKDDDVCLIIKEKISQLLNSLKFR